MKKQFILTIVFLMSFILCLSMTSCSEDEENPSEVIDQVTTLDPNSPTQPSVDETAIKNAASQLFNEYATNPNKVSSDLQTMEKNWKIENIETNASNMIGFDDLNIDKIYLTDTMIHTVYKTEDYYTGEYVPTDEYTFLGEYGSFSIQYDGFTYRYSFSPLEDELENKTQNYGGPVVAPEQMWYNPSQSCFMLDSTVLVDWLRYSILNQTVENELFDLSALESILDTLYIDCYFNLNEDMSAFTYFQVLATNYPEEGLRAEVFSLQYKVDSQDVAFRFDINLDVKATLNFHLKHTTDVTYEMDSSLLLRSSAGIIDPTTLTVSANITVASDPYIQITGFFRDKVEIAENLIKNAKKIDATYMGDYIVEDALECESIYVYDDKIKAYLIFEMLDNQSYSYMGFNPYYDSTLGCLGVIDFDRQMLTATTHRAEETLKTALEEKYNGKYTCTDSCNSLYIYDEDYEVYIIFEREFGEEYYVYERYLTDAAYSNNCQCMIDLDNNTIQVVSHSAIEQTIESIKDLVFEIYNLEKGACAQAIVYDEASEYYLLFSIDGGKARYAGYSSYEFVNACRGYLHFGSQTLTIEYHPHSHTN